MSSIQDPEKSEMGGISGILDMYGFDDLGTSEN